LQGDELMPRIIGSTRGRSDRVAVKLSSAP